MRLNQRSDKGVYSCSRGDGTDFTGYGIVSSLGLGVRMIDCLEALALVSYFPPPRSTGVMVVIFSLQATKSRRQEMNSTEELIRGRLYPRIPKRVPVPQRSRPTLASPFLDVDRR